MQALRQRVQAVLKGEGLDAIVASAPENVFYVSGYRSLASSVIRGVQIYAVLNSQSLALVLSRADVPCALEAGLPEAELFSYGGFHFDLQEANPQHGFPMEVQSVLSRSYATPMEALTAALDRMAGDSKSVAADRAGLSLEVWEGLTNRYGTPQIRDGADLFRSVRRAKTEDEVERIEMATRISEDAIFATLQQVREGMTEQEMVQIFEQQELKDGGRPWFTVIACGERAAFADSPPTSRPLKLGDIIRFDVGCTYGGYHSDIARTAVFGSPTTKLVDYYNAILAGEQREFEYLRPGVLANEVFHRAMETVRSEGIPHYERHHCGHGIGLEVYDPPLIGPNDQTVLEEGMVFCLETPYYEIGWGGLLIEDTVVITKEGARMFNQRSRELQIVE